MCRSSRVFSCAGLRRTLARRDVIRLRSSNLPRAQALAHRPFRRDHEAKTTEGGAVWTSAIPIQARGAGASQHPPAPASEVTFSRRELDRILRLYGRKVAAGEWRDYAIDFLKDRAVFSVFRRASEMPIYRIEKNPKLGRRQGAYSVISATGHIVRRGHELDRVLGALDRSLRVVAG